MRKNFAIVQIKVRVSYRDNDDFFSELFNTNKYVGYRKLYHDRNVKKQLLLCNFAFSSHALGFIKKYNNDNWFFFSFLTST